MKYIIMCGGNYDKFKKPKQLTKVAGEILVERTIRILKENGVTDIAISTNNPAFDYIDIPKLRDKDNQFEYWGKDETKKSKNSWLRAYYPVNEPVCYIHGDVYFSDEAIKTIVNTDIKETMFFCTYDKQDGPKDTRSSGGREPFAYKVENYKLFRDAVDTLLQMVDDGKFKGFPPCSWNVYRYLNGLDIGLNARGYGDLNNIFKSKGDYIVINDYTNDIDDITDVKKIEMAINYIGGNDMEKYKVKAKIRFNDYGGEEINNKNIFTERKPGDEFVCSKERYEYLLEHKAVELIEVLFKEEEKKEVITELPIEEIEEPVIVEAEEEPVKVSKKKNKKRK